MADAAPAPLDYLVDAGKEEETDILARLHRMVQQAVVHPVRQNWELESSLNYQYVENDFYTAEELEELAERGQPPTRRNEIAPILERIAGQFIQTRQVATFLGRNTPADDPLAAIAQDYQRWNDQQSLYEFEEQDQVWDGLVGGVGWLKAIVSRNDLGEQEVRWRARNPYYVFPDPYATRYDPNEDAKYIAEGAWIDLEDAVALYPEKEAELRGFFVGGQTPGLWASQSVAASLKNEALAGSISSLDTYIDQARRRVRPFEVWYKRKVKVYYVLRPDGVVALPIALDQKEAQKIVRALDGDVISKPVYQDRMYVGVFLAHLLIHHDVSPHETNLFPYIPFYTGRRKNGAPLPLTSRLVPINEAINKRESKALALMTNRQMAVERNAVEDPEEVRSEYAKPDGYMVFREGALSGNKVIFRDNLDMGQAQFALLQEDKDAIRRVSGQGNEAMGMPSEVRSGTGIARKQMMSNLIVTPMHNSLRRTRTLRARLSFALMKQYLTAPMTFQITDDPNPARLVEITRSHVQALKERTYDIVVTEMKDYATLREQQAEMLLTALPQLAPLGPGMVKLGIQLSDLRDKDGLLKMVDQQSQPAPAVPKINLAMTWADLTPEVQAYLAYSALQSPELAQAIMQKGDDPAFLQKLKAGLIQTKVKEGTRAQMERGKVDLAAYQTAIEGRMQMMEFMNPAPSSPDTGLDDAA